MYRFLLLLLLPLSLHAQPAERAPLNQLDQKGRREGLWLLQHPERMGEGPYSEFGNFVSGRKNGIWYRMDPMGDILAIERFRNNVLDGEAKYFEQGRLVCIGHYRGLNPAQAYDTILVLNPVTGVERLTPIPTDRGTVRHGIWRYYDPETGRLIREEDYQADELLAHQEFPVSNRDSLYYEQRNRNLPHNRRKIYSPPAGKSHHIDH